MSIMSIKICRMLYNFIGDNMVMKLRIRDLREDNDLTQKAVAKHLMCDQSLYSKYERGEREIPLKLVVELAKFYNVSVDYLVGLTDENMSYCRKV